MLEKYSEQKGVSYEDALLAFAESPIYALLFDYSSKLWTQGPDYLLNVFEKAGE